jgi:hypothetical protein
LTNADLLKENLVNKSTNVTTDGTSNTKYPSVKSVKDYVDAGVATATTAVTNEATIRAAADIIAFASSDERLKENKVLLTDVLDKV